MRVRRYFDGVVFRPIPRRVLVADIQTYKDTADMSEFEKQMRVSIQIYDFF